MADNEFSDSRPSSSSVNSNIDNKSSNNCVPSVQESETVTMIDVLNEEFEMEENAFAVLAGSDDSHCTRLQPGQGR